MHFMPTLVNLRGRQVFVVGYILAQGGRQMVYAPLRTPTEIENRHTASQILSLRERHSYILWQICISHTLILFSYDNIISQAYH